MEATSSKSCQIEGCKRPYRAKGYCKSHFKKWRRGAMPKKRRYKTCSEENCRKPIFKFGKCETHYKADQGQGTKDQGPTIAHELPKEETKGDKTEEKKE